jgi:hypothetical protein
MIYQVATNVGIGDIVYTKTLLDQVIHRHQEIHVCTNEKAYESRKPVQEDIQEWDVHLPDKNVTEYRKFVAKLFSWLFTDPRYKINLDADYRHRTIQDICEDHGIEPAKPNLKKYLWANIPGLPDEYVVIQTKSRLFNYGELSVTGGEIWSAIASLSNRYKIIVMGEREVEQNREYSAGFSLGAMANSMYSEVMAHVPKRNIIDMTVPALGLTPPDFDKFQYDCHIISKAKSCISFGYGGGFCIALSFGKVLCYKNYDTDETRFLFSKEKIEDSLVTGNQDKFIREIENL